MATKPLLQPNRFRRLYGNSDILAGHFTPITFDHLKGMFHTDAIHIVERHGRVLEINILGFFKPLLPVGRYLFVSQHRP